MSIKLFILDRDDTLIRVPAGRIYLHGDDDIVLADGALEFVRALNRAGVPVVIATNQQGVALAGHPEMTLESVDRFHQRLFDEVGQRGARVERAYVCPHAADAGCDCRKPRPGLFLRAMRDFRASPEETAAIGDRWRDVQAAHAAGIRALYLIRRSHSRPDRPPELADVRVISAFDECLGELVG